MCREPSRGKCSASSSVYRMQCERAPCNKEETDNSVYIGETSHTIYIRGSQHLGLYRGKKEGSFMHKHAVECHGGVLGVGGGINDFSMEALNRGMGPLNRVLEEAVRIQEIDSDPKIKVLNSKLEYYGAQYVRPAFVKGPADHW